MSDPGITAPSISHSPTNTREPPVSYVTLVRFDPVYVQHFKCNIRDIRSGYPHLHKWMRNLYWNNTAFKDM